MLHKVEWIFVNINFIDHTPNDGFSNTINHIQSDYIFISIFHIIPFDQIIKRYIVLPDCYCGILENRHMEHISDSCLFHHCKNIEQWQRLVHFTIMPIRKKRENQNQYICGTQSCFNWIRFTVLVYDPIVNAFTMDVWHSHFDLLMNRWSATSFTSNNILSFYWSIKCIIIKNKIIVVSNMLHIKHAKPIARMLYILNTSMFSDMHAIHSIGVSFKVL